MFLVVEEGVWRDVEEVNVGDVVRGFFEWAFVWGDVDPHGGGLFGIGLRFVEPFQKRPANLITFYIF
jgi:hypothetical protein